MNAHISPPAMPVAAEGLPRHKIETAIEALIERLDAADPDQDLEPNLADSRNDLEGGDDNGIADFDGMAESASLSGWHMHGGYVS